MPTYTCLPDGYWWNGVSRGPRWDEVTSDNGYDLGDGFILRTRANLDAGLTATMPGTSVPDTNWVGALPDVPRVAYNGPTIITTNDHRLEGYTFDVKIEIRAARVRMHNCESTYTYDQFSGGGLIDCRSSLCVDFVATRCTFRPNPVGTSGYDAIYGHDWTARQCIIEHTCDGFGAVNQYGPLLNVHIEGCWIGNLAWFYDDGVHYNGTHNDGCQNHSSKGLWVVGNTFWAYKYNALGTPVLDSSADNLHPQSSQIVLCQHSAYYEVGDIHVNGNFIYGGDQGIKFMSNKSFGDKIRVAYEVELLDNLWMNDDQRVYTVRIPVRFDTLITVNGQTFSAGINNVGNGNNRWADVPEVAAARRGQLVNFVVDQAA